MSESPSPPREPEVALTAKVLPQKRGPHPIAAAWTAGLTLSSKGGVVKRQEITPNESVGIVKRLGVQEITVKPKERIQSNVVSYYIL